MKGDILAGQNPDNIILLIALYADGTMIKVWLCFLKQKAQEPNHRPKSEVPERRANNPGQKSPVATTGNKWLSNVKSYEKNLVLPFA